MKLTFFEKNINNHFDIKKNDKQINKITKDIFLNDEKRKFFILNRFMKFFDEENLVSSVFFCSNKFLYEDKLTFSEKKLKEMTSMIKIAILSNHTYYYWRSKILDIHFYNSQMRMRKSLDMFCKKNNINIKKYELPKQDYDTLLEMGFKIPQIAHIEETIMYVLPLVKYTNKYWKKSNELIESFFKNLIIYYYSYYSWREFKLYKKPDSEFTKENYNKSFIIQGLFLDNFIKDAEKLLPKDYNLILKLINGKCTYFYTRLNGRI